MSGARDSAAEHRAKQTVRNLVLSLVVSLGVVLLLVLGVPRDDSMRIQPVDYAAEALAASEAIKEPVFAPVLPEEWWANAARLEANAGVSSWYIGMVTPTNQFVGLRQAFVSNPSWLALQLAGNERLEDVTIAGVQWQQWQATRPSNPPKSSEFALVFEYEPGAVVVFGTASFEEIELVAASLASQLTAATEG